jgi:hypothetical protein
MDNVTTRTRRLGRLCGRARRAYGLAAIGTARMDGDAARGRNLDLLTLWWPRSSAALQRMEHTGLVPHGCAGTETEPGMRLSAYELRPESVGRSHRVSRLG